MLDLWKELTERQLHAALSTLGLCIDACPDHLWDAPVANIKFCQVAFHTLFFTDCYLGSDDRAYLDQAFHRDHLEYFRDYEEMVDRPQTYLYDRPTTVAYLHHCRKRASDVIVVETAESLAAPCGFPWLKRRDFSRAETYLYTIRHIQHHAAALSLRLRLDAGSEIPWVFAGWGT